MADQCGHRIMAITSAFQADDAGSIPADRSKLDAIMQVVFFVQTPPPEQRTAKCDLCCSVELTAGKDRHLFLTLAFAGVFAFWWIRFSLLVGL